MASCSTPRRFVRLAACLTLGRGAKNNWPGCICAVDEVGASQERLGWDVERLGEHDELVSAGQTHALLDPRYVGLPERLACSLSKLLLRQALKLAKVADIETKVGTIHVFGVSCLVQK